LKNRDWPYTDTDFSLSDKMSSYWVNFAASGDPNGSNLPKWTAYEPSNEPYLDLGDTVQMKNHLLKLQLDTLESAQQQRRQTTQR
jgi:para-nitrobenzyl esterase